MNSSIKFYTKPQIPTVNIDTDKNLSRKNNRINLKNDFLNIFLAQIKNQDPTNPLKNNDLTSQLAQININNGIEKINYKLSSITKDINNQISFKASKLIGHGILFPNSTIKYSNKQDTIFGVYLPKDISSAEIVISDRDGRMLFFKNLRNLKSGVYDFTWNDISNNSKKINNETYHLAIYARNKNENISCEPLGYGVVHGIINLKNKKQMIDLGESGIIELENIRKIF
ncbi:flagellar hook assembly protein FlgD [Buchnera aphidicola]|uniref:flagellar hook assembly protein FlgD n=1 Tax=Buchnera aphidicola TaxID=9 RepID=UPI0034645382